MITQLSDLFLEGSMAFMSILTLLLALLLLSAWKAPAWVCDIGNIALALGILFTGLGAYQACVDIQQAGYISTSILSMLQGTAIPIIGTRATGTRS